MKAEDSSPSLMNAAILAATCINQSAVSLSIIHHIHIRSFSICRLRRIAHSETEA